MDGNGKMVLTVEDAAEALSVCTKTIRQKLEAGELEYFRLSDSDKGKIRITATAVATYIERRTKAASERVRR